MVFHADSYMMEELLFGLIPVLTSAVPSLLVGIASYVLTSLALYTLASRRGIRKAWLSWVPVLNVWIVGSLSDQYRYVVKGQVKSKRKILLTLKLLSLFLGLCAFTVAAFTVADAVHSTLYGVRFQMILRQFMAPVMGILGLGLPIAGLSIAALVFYYMALYDIYVSMDPGNSVLFTVLSILFRVTKPVFLFINRNKDGGMPPRREVPRQEPPCQEDETREYL
jgi:hypothetical protein